MSVCVCVKKKRKKGREARERKVYGVENWGERVGRNLLAGVV